MFSAGCTMNIGSKKLQREVGLTFCGAQPDVSVSRFFGRHGAFAQHSLRKGDATQHDLVLANHSPHAKNVMKILHSFLPFISRFLLRFCSNVESGGSP
jgi:hypothetical protein